MIPKREPYRSIFKLLTTLGFWNEVPKRQKRIAMFMMYICTVVFSLLIMLSLFQATELNDILEGIKLIPILWTIVISVNDFILKKPKIRKLLELIEEIELESPESKSYFDKAFGQVKNIIVTEVTFIAGLYVSFVISPLILDRLMFPAFIPSIIKDYKSTFYAYWLYECLCGLYCAFLHLPIHEFRCSLLIVLHGYMSFFQTKLRMIRSTKENFDEAKDQLAECVKIHLQIKKFMDIYIEIFSMQFSMILFLSSFCVCSNTFIIVTYGSTVGLKAVIFSMFYEGFVFGLIFVPCFYSNTLMYQSKGFMNDLFSSDWIESGVKYRKLMLIFMENLKIKVVFRILEFVDIDLQLFLQIIQTVYSMYAVLQSMKD